MGAKQSAPQPRYYLNQPTRVWTTTPAGLALIQIVDAIMKKDTATYTKLLDENKTEYQTKPGGDNVYPFQHALQAAITYQNLDAIKLLVETYGADVSAPLGLNCTPLDQALNPNHANPTIIRYLIEKGAKLNYVSKCKFEHAAGLTPLITLIGYYNTFNDIELVKFFIDHGADVNFKPKGAPSVLDVAAYDQSQNTELIEYLVSKGAKPSPDYNEKNLLLVAAIERGAPVSYARALIDSGGIDINAIEPRSKTTALMMAIFKNNAPMVKLLIEKGADPNRGHTIGLEMVTPIKFASQPHISQEIKNVLQQNRQRVVSDWAGGRRRKTYRKKGKKSKKTRRH